MSKGPWDLKKLMFAVQGGFCFYCWKLMTLDTAHKQAHHYASKDHLQPLSQGGAHDWTNTVLACLACNRAKSDRLPTEAERTRHGHILALFNERVMLREAEIAARQAAAPPAAVPQTASSMNDASLPAAAPAVAPPNDALSTAEPQTAAQADDAPPFAAPQAAQPDEARPADNAS